MTFSLPRAPESGLPSFVGAVAVLGVALMRRSFFGAKAVGRAAHLAGQHTPVTVSDGILVLIPVKGEPDQAEASARWWMAQDVADVWFVTSETEQPPLTHRRLASIPGVKVFRGQAANKAGQINNALADIPSDLKAVAFFDSDSRPVGSVALMPRSLVTVGPSLYRSNFSSPHFAFTEGLALAQTIWSLGFEADMGDRRRLWYTVGHGLVLGRVVLGEKTFDDSLLVEDLEFGYRLSPRSSAKEGHFQDVSLFFASPSTYMEGIGRWFVGDLQAVLRQGASPLVVVRAFELAATWLLGPTLASLSVLRLAREDSRWGAGSGLLLAVVTVLPAELVRRRVWPLLGVDGGFRRATAAGVGVLARPWLDSIACTVGLFRFAFKKRSHSTASAKPTPSRQRPRASPPRSDT